MPESSPNSNDNPYRAPAETSPAALEAALHDPYSALRLPAFRRFLSGNVLAIFGMQMQTMAVGWEIYERTGSKWSLGMVGLVQFLPVILLTLFAGQAADRFPRKWIIVFTLSCIGLCSLGLAAVSLSQGPLWMMYACLFLSGVSRAFMQPAKSSFLPQIIPRLQFSNALTWNMSAFQLAAVAGPAAAGILIAITNSATIVYLLDATGAFVFVGLLCTISNPAARPSKQPMNLKNVLAGARFVWDNKVILAAMTLDMFAVLLGGATMLLPVYAKDILDVGAEGLGWLRGAPGVGALMMSVILAYRPPLERAGRVLLASVVGFGVATMVFGISRSFWLSLAMLFLTGAFDIVSVVIRHTLVQTLTPDSMRGRVSAVNSVFIGASNELGGFESGAVAAIFTPTVSVVSGGVGTLLVAWMVAVLWPQLGRYGRLGGHDSDPWATDAPQASPHSTTTAE